MEDKKEFKKDEVSQEELENQEIENLPDREEMSLINANAAIPVNAAVSANVLSDHSTATSTASQNAPINQKLTE